MAEQHGREGQGFVHKSAHPSLPPAAPQQVVQYLLAKNFYLTALELVVEAQQAGHGDDVRDLEAFFADPERFPMEELARHQPGNVFDLQAAGRERESRLQLVEYELRLAKEDLSEMSRKLAAALDRQSGPGAGVASGAVSNGRTSAGAPSTAISLGKDSSAVTTGKGGHLTAFASGSSYGSGPAGGPSPGELRVLNTAVFAHLQRQGLLASAMTLEEEYGGSLRPTGHGSSSPVPGAIHGSDAELRWELWSWYQAAAASLTLSAEPEPADMISVEGDMSSSAITALTNNPAAATDGTESPTFGAAAATTSYRTDSQISEQPLPSLSLPQSTRPIVAPVAQPAAEHVAATAACVGTAAAPGPALTPGSSERSSQPLPMPSWLAQLDSGYVSSLEGLRTSLVGTLPRLVPSLTYKSRVEVLPVLVAATQASSDWSDRQQLLELAFNLAPAPDHQQRQVIIEACLELCRAFGPGWTASELLPLCCRQAGSPSAERRTLVAEALGAVVELVDTGTQAHVVLTQLSQLARDRIERVREAAVLSLARLVPRLPPARPYLSTVEALLLPAASDPAEIVHSAALSHLVPALLTWQSPVGSAVVGGMSDGSGGSDGVNTLDMLLVSSSLASVVGELGAQVRLIEQQQEQQKKPSVEVGQAGGTAIIGSGGGGGGGSFGGNFLRYSLIAPVADGGSPSTSATDAVDGETTAAVAGPAGAMLPLHPASPAAPVSPSPTATLPAPAQAVPFGGRQFPSAAHLAVYQLLTLYMGLVPVVRRVALQTIPPWAAIPAATSTASPRLATRYHHRVGSFAEVMPDATTQYEAAGGNDAPRLRSSSPSTATSLPLSPAHRRTASHPVLLGSAGEQPVTPAARGSNDGISSGGEQKKELEGAGAQDNLQAADGDEGGMVDGGAGSWEQDVVLAAWATHPGRGSWKTLEWVMQHVVPELLRLLRCVNPATPTEAEVWRQAAAAVAATCKVLGVPFTRAALIPIFLAACGYGATEAAPVSGSGGGVEYDAPVAVRDLCLVEQPRSPKALRVARQTLLPVLLASVLAPCGQLRPHLEALMGTAHELRQRWLMEALPDYIFAITWACASCHDLKSDVLRVLETLLSGASSSSSGANNATPTSTRTAAEATAQAAQAHCARPSSSWPASTAVGLCCAALARALVPLASLELASRRLLPALMALMSYGELELQRACVGILAELGLRFWAEGPRVSEQVLAVFDSLLEQGSHIIQLEVLAAGIGLAVAAAPSGAVSAAAAAQVEWLLMVVRATATRLATMSHAAGNAATVTLLNQHRTMARQLLVALRAVAPYDLQLPRLQANFASALEAMQRCKALLTDPVQQAALTALAKERTTGPSSTVGPFISSIPAVNVSCGTTTTVTPITPLHGAGPHNMVLKSAPHSALPLLSGSLASSYQVPQGSGAHGTAQGPVLLDITQAGGSQMRSRFDAFRQRLMKRRDEPTSAAVPAGERPKESFFSDDEEGV